MNILFFLYKFPIYGGVERITITLASALQKKGYNIFIISLKGEAEELLSDLHHNIKYYSFPDNQKFTSSSNIAYFIQIVTQENIQYIINQGCYLQQNKFLQYISKTIKIPIISVLHNDPLGPMKDIKRHLQGHDWKSKTKKKFIYLYKIWVKYLMSKDYKRISSYSKKIVLLSHSYINSFQKYSQCSYSQIKVIPNCFYFHQKTKNAPKENIVLYVGRVVEQQKRLSRLLDIWKLINNPEWKLFIVGDGNDLENYKKKVYQEHINNVNFYGYQKDVKSYMEKASIFTLVSDFEGFPMTLIEAMNERCIPIAYESFSAIHDVIHHGTNGFIINPFDGKSYAKYLNKLINDKRLRESISQESYKTSLQYEIDKILPNWENILTK